MSSIRSRLAWSTASPKSPVDTVLLACLTALLCYLAAELGGALVLRPQLVWPLWPGSALLIAVLLLLPRGIWPILIAAGLAGFVLYDLRAGLTLRSIALLILADTVEIVIASLGVSYFCGRLPRLNSVASLARYSFPAVILAPVAAAFISASASSGNYWIRWRIAFFTEALALLTLTPAILAWVRTRQTWVRQYRAFYFESATLLAGLILLGYLAFVAPVSSSAPVLLYSLLPFLLWSALRFGILGISTSMMFVAFLSIWGAVHGRGPFTGAQPLNNVMSLQLFLLLAVAPFMVLAALVEERKRTLHALRESEERFRLMADTAPAMIWMSGTDKLCTYFNKPWLNFTGRSMGSELGNGWAEGVHAEDLGKCMDTYSQAFDRREEFRMEYRLRRHDGEYRWIFDIGVPRFDEERSFLGYIGSCVDLTERKLAETALANVSGRMIEAQEKERSRIARELHDDIGQRLALLTINLRELHQGPTDLPGVRSHVGELTNQISAIATDIQTLSHGLHSSKLEYLGLAAAMRGFCKEFSDQQKVEIDFETHDLPRTLSPDISLCFFRVLQEALQNSVKYSGVRHFDVRSWGTPNEIHLMVRDLGSGFDIEAAKAGRGLGLISMGERLKILNGTLSIESQLKLGTTIHAFVPLSPGGDFGA